MTFKRLNLSVLGIIWLIFGLHFLATKLYLYSSVWWFDMLMHFLGGVFIAVTAVSLLRAFKILDKNKNIFWAVFLVLGTGLVWELFEIGVDKIIVHAPLNAPNPVDSISDIFFDLSGGLFALVLVFYRKKNEKIEEGNNIVIQ